jgi:hypothetical protein
MSTCFLQIGDFPLLAGASGPTILQEDLNVNEASHLLTHHSNGSSWDAFNRIPRFSPCMPEEWLTWQVTSRLHRDRIVRSIKQLMLGLGHAPSPPQVSNNATHFFLMPCAL